MAAPRTVGPYEVVRELGRGGMGVVLEVKRPGVERRLALKLMTLDGVEPVALERFGREAQLLAKVRHPNVLSVHELGRTPEGRPYIVTDLVEGSNLKTVAREAPVDPDRAARIVAALAGAVSALHEKGILHRDLKPENVILRAGDDPVLLDFGLAREHDARSLTQSGQMLGTPAYMSPEQAEGTKGKGLDARTDVYGVGAILFELLAGRPPFDTSGELQKIVAVLTKDPSWPIETRKDIPPPLDGLVRRAMAKNREDRFASAAAFKGELEKFLRKESVVKAPPPASAGRGRWLAIFAALTLAAGVGAGAWLATRPVGHDAPPVQPPVTGVTTATTPERPTVASIPSIVETETPAGYRERVRVMERVSSFRERDRKRLEELLAGARTRPITISLTMPLLSKESVRVRFLSDRWLAIFAYTDGVYVMDLDDAGIRKEHQPALLWKLESPRAWDVALGPLVDGVRRAFIATTWRLLEADFAPRAAPGALAGPSPTPVPSRWADTEGDVKAVQVSRDGAKIAYAIGSTFYVRDLTPADRSSAGVFTAGHQVAQIAFVESDTRVLATCDSSKEAVNKVAWIGIQRVFAPREESAEIEGGFTADARGMAVATGDFVAFAPSQGQLQVARRTPIDVHGLESVPDDRANGTRRLAVGGREPCIYAARRGPTGQQFLTVRRFADLQVIPGRDVPRGIGSDPDAVAVSPDGALVVVSGQDESRRPMVQFWAAGD
ncbi:MAG: serine/threonine-protein kinase [Planctomycetota bacterium]